MFNPEHLLSITSKDMVKQNLRALFEKHDTHKTQLFDFLIDSLWISIQAQKQTLKKYNWNAPDFVENSPLWLQWAGDTADILPAHAVYAEEIWHTYELWNNINDTTTERLNLMSLEYNQKLGVSDQAHFAIYDYLKIDEPENYIDPQKQACFIETLQHERVHLFCRYWHMLERDIPLASSLGLISAQIQMERYDQNDYEIWTLTGLAYKRSDIRRYCERPNKRRFLKEVSVILRKYNNRIENRESYFDGYLLAYASGRYFRDLNKARMFLEFLAYGINGDTAHDFAIGDKEFTEIKDHYTVFDGLSGLLKMSGWWSPGDGKIGVCAREHILNGEYSVLKHIFEKNGLGEKSIIHMIGLRGADQVEASHYKLLDHSTFTWYSLPHCTYSSKPLVGDETIKMMETVKSMYRFKTAAFELEDYMMGKGYTKDDLRKELDNPQSTDMFFLSEREKLLKQLDEGTTHKHDLISFTRMLSGNTQAFSDVITDGI